MTLIVLIGASGSGKTAIAKAIAAMRAEVCVFYFDDIGVPSADDMVAQFGAPEAWQHAMTVAWFARLANITTTAPMLFEGQTRLAFLEDGSKRAGNLSYRPLLVDCDDQERARRLADRGQPELANASMTEWASYLRRDATARDCEILDTSRLTLRASVDHVLALLDGA